MAKKKSRHPANLTIFLILILLVAILFAANYFSSYYFSSYLRKSTNIPFAGKAISSENKFNTMGQEQTENTGWYSWAKDNHNSRIADDAVAPPLKLMWRQSMHNVDVYSWISRLLYQNGELFATSGHDVEALNATTGGYIWNHYLGAAGVWSRAAALANNHIFGGTDHGGTWSASQGTGGFMASGSNPGYSQANEQGTEVYSLGSPCIDCSNGARISAIKIINEPLIQATEGKINGAWEFPAPKGYYGVGSDYMNLGEFFNFAGRNWTIMFWINATGGRDTFFIKGNDPNYPPISISTWDGNLLEVHLQPEWGTFGDVPITPGEWTHIAVTFDHQNVRIYKNGILAFEKEKTTDTGDVNETYLSGGDGDSFDEMAVFDRALTSDEIANKYDKEIVPDANTKVLYHFDNNPAYGENTSFVHDFSGNGNDYVYDGHQNTIIAWGIGVGGYNNGVPTNFWGGAAGYGTPVENDGIVYTPAGMIFAVNSSTGAVIWQQGQYPYSVNPGDVLHKSNIVYSDGIIYSAGYEAITSVSCPTPPSPCLPAYNGWTPATFKGQKFYAYNATNGDLLFSFNLSAVNGDVSEIIIKNGVAYLRGGFGMEYNEYNDILDGGSLSAFRVSTGELLWQHNGTGGDIALSGNLIYALDYPGEDVVALDTATGNVIWRFSIPENKCPSSNDACSSGFYREGFTGLVVEGNNVFVSTSKGDIYAFESGYENPSIFNNQTVLSAGMQNLAYATKSFHPVNGEGPFVWSVSSGRIPNGMSFVSDSDGYDGVLSGTPTESGNFNFTARVTDNRGSYDEKEFSLKILPDSKEFTTILQEGVNNYTGCEDAGIDGFNGYYQTINYGNTTFIGGHGGYELTEDYNTRGLLKFNIFQKEGGPVPDDAIITGASMVLNKADSSAHTISGYQILKNWSEMEVTWNQASDGDNWSVPGADSEGLDRGSKLFEGNDFTVWRGVTSSSPGPHYFDITNLTKGYDSGLENNGWLLTQSSQSTLQIYSCDYINGSAADNGASMRPQLTIKYKRFNPDNNPPVVKVYANPSVVLSSNNVTFDASQSYDPDENDSVASYEWDQATSGFYNSQEPYFFKKQYTLQDSNPYYCACCRGQSSPYCSGIDINAWCAANFNLQCPPPNMTFSQKVSVYDNYGTRSDAIVNVLVVGSFSSTTVTTTMLKNGKVGKAYSDYVYAQPAGNYVWSVASGSLPDGLILNSGTGEISGTPTTAGNYSFVVDVSGVQQSLSVEIADSIEELSYADEDVNQDRNVNIIDLILVALNFGTQNCNSGNDWCARKDVAHAGSVNIQSLIKIALRMKK